MKVKVLQAFIAGVQEKFLTSLTRFPKLIQGEPE